MRAGAFHAGGRWQPAAEQGTDHPSFSHQPLGKGVGCHRVTVCAVITRAARAVSSDLQVAELDPE